MLKLLNRFAWLISIILGVLIMYIGGYDFIIWGVLGTFLIKHILFSKSFIEERLQYFSDRISEKIKKDVFGENTNQKHTKKYENLLKKPDESIEIKEKVNIENTEKVEKIVSPKKVEETFFGKIGDWIKEFFSENLIGKIGGILLFLGVLFFLALIYTAVGPVAKLIIGFTVGFSIYITGVFLFRKGFKNEAMILLGIAILINYLVILSGRYLIGNNYHGMNSVPTGVLTVLVTFFFLILNTIFAVVTAIVYESKVLLIFSFIFAYLNPLLIGGTSANPYTLVGYSIIISLGGLYLSNYKKEFVLAGLSFVLGNFLILISTSGNEIGFITKVISSSLLSFISIITVYKNYPKYLNSLFIGTYLFLMVLLFSSGFLKETGGFIISILSIILFFGFGIFYFLKTSINSLLYVLIFPIFLVLGIMLNGSLVFIPPTLALIVIVYIFGFSFIFKKSSIFFNYLFFIVLGLFVLLSFSSRTFVMDYGLGILEFVTFIITSFIFLFTSYYLSSKKELGYLYAIGTFFSVLMLSMVININLYGDNLIQISALAIIVFAIINWFTPFYNNNLIEEKSNLKSLLIGNVFGVLFLGYQLYSFGLKYFPGLTTGLSFVGFSIIYFAISYLLINKIGIQNIKDKSLGEHSRNLVYSYLGTSISIFSLAILIVFSEHNEIISTIWLLEATLLYFFFYKTSENKILVAGNILFLIGVVFLFNLLDVVGGKEFMFLIPFTIIFISFIANLRFLEKCEGEKIIFHDIFHIIGIGVLGFLLIKIIPSTGHGWSNFGVSIFILILSLIYSYFSSNILKKFFSALFILFLIKHIGDINIIFDRIDNDNLKILRILQYTSTILLGISVYIWSKFNKISGYNYLFKGSYLIYLFIITSFYIYDIFDTTFAITMYWGALSFILVNYGLSKNIIRFRTIGLYIISITCIKIFLYDVWYGLDNAISRVFIFMVIGALFIYISTSYSKRFGNKLKGEFDLNNLKDEKKEDIILK